MVGFASTNLRRQSGVGSRDYGRFRVAAFRARTWVCSARGESAQKKGRAMMADNLRRLEFMTEPELRELMENYAIALEIIAEKMHVEKPRFCLVVFNDPKVAQYIANCERDCMIEAMRETAERLDKRETVERVRFD
jgi:hypothetical protein